MESKDTKDKLALISKIHRNYLESSKYYSRMFATIGLICLCLVTGRMLTL